MRRTGIENCKNLSLSSTRAKEVLNSRLLSLDSFCKIPTFLLLHLQITTRNRIFWLSFFRRSKRMDFSHGQNCQFAIRNLPKTRDGSFFGCQVPRLSQSLIPIPAIQTSFQIENLENKLIANSQDKAKIKGPNFCSEITLLILLIS